MVFVYFTLKEGGGEKGGKLFRSIGKEMRFVCFDDVGPVAGLDTWSRAPHTPFKCPSIHMYNEEIEIREIQVNFHQCVQLPCRTTTMKL